MVKDAKHVLPGDKVKVFILLTSLSSDICKVPIFTKLSPSGTTVGVQLKIILITDQTFNYFQMAKKWPKQCLQIAYFVPPTVSNPDDKIAMPIVIGDPVLLTV